MKRCLLAIALSLSFYTSKAVCPNGQVEVTISIKTDDYANEGYWELLPQGNTCGTGTIFSGGNTNVGCNGAGNQSSPPGGYASNSIITEGPWCLTQGNSYDILYNDDWTDGGFVFTVYVNGYPVHSGLAGSGNNTRFTFVANAPPQFDIACKTVKTPSYVAYGNVYPKAWIMNLGTDTIHSFDYYYTIDNNPVQMCTITGIQINPFDSLVVSSTVAWNVSATTDYTLFIYANNPNGSADMNPANDSTQRRVAGGPGIPNIVNDYLIGNPVVTIIADSSSQLDLPVDLDFHPVLTRYELWVVLRGTSNGGGSTVKFANAGKSNQTFLKQSDSNARHFMDLPSAIAFSDNENFSTAPSVYDANHDGGSPFTGPTLWSSDSTIYCHTPPGGNGSHIDMLHQSPYSMGLCWEEDNRFWDFDDQNHAIVMYDFKRDHGPGNSDHSDGVVRQFDGLGISGDPNHFIGSHLILDHSSGMLYIADTWNNRILRMDIHSGTFLQNLTPYEPIAEYSEWQNPTWNVFVDSALNHPSGIDLIEDRLVVSDYQTGDIIIYDASGSTGIELGRIHTGNPGVMGIKIGPDGKIWGVNTSLNQLFRIDGASLGTNEFANAVLSVYPNPTDDKLNILLNGKESNSWLTISSISGSVIMEQGIPANERNLSLDVSNLSSGIYLLRIKNANDILVKKFVKN